jgi:hypothetical protein
LAAPLSSRVVRLRAEPLVVAASTPFVFLHPHYQPSFAVGPVTVTLTDVAILAAALAAVSAGLRAGWAPLRSGRSLWLPLVLFMAWLLASLAWGDHADPRYGLQDHLVSAAKFVEYAALAAVVPLTLRRAGDRRLFYWTVALWSAFLTLIGVLQFLGVVDEFEGKRPQQREPSYIGIHDLGAISGAALCLAFVAIVAGRRTRLAVLGGIAGALGVIVAAANDAILGMAAAAVSIWGLARRHHAIGTRRTLGLLALVAVVALGGNALRSSTISAFLEFLGVAKPSQETNGQVQSYSQRTVLAYIGFEIWLRNPVIGAGWQESHNAHSYEPILPRARRRFPHVAAATFPSHDHPWGVQNGIVQTLADLGAIGFVLAAWTFLAGGLLAVRAALRGPPALAREGQLLVGWLLVGLLVFTFTGLLPGVAVDALLWLTLGLAVSLHRSLTTPG